MTLEETAFRLILDFYDQAKAGGWNAFTTAIHRENPPLMEITTHFRDDPDALKADIRRQWQQFADTLDTAKQRPLYDAWKTLEEKLHSPSTPLDDRELVREACDKAQHHFNACLSADQWSAYNHLMEISRHIERLEEDERFPEHAPAEHAQPRQYESHSLSVAAPAGLSAAE
ncbi:MAG: hypothetical protein KGJ06_07605, partial [Pseudomonadota bacterium]|nr:hypothetical protein [Pseudomonadota bacterium]